MSLAASSLQKAVFQHLNNDGALTLMIGLMAINDHPSAPGPRPQVLIGAIDTADASTASDDSEEHFLSVEIWSQSDGHAQVEAVCARIHMVLHHAELMVAGFDLVDLAWRSTKIRRDGPTRSHVAEMRFRALTG